MKLNEEYLLTTIFDQPVLLPVGMAVVLKYPTIKLDEAGFFLLQNLNNTSTKEELLSLFFNTYKESFHHDQNALESFFHQFLTRMLDLGIILP